MNTDVEPRDEYIPTLSSIGGGILGGGLVFVAGIAFVWRWLR